MFTFAGEIGTVDIVEAPAGSLFNTTIGKGLAGRPSNTTLLLVEVSGPGFAGTDVGTLLVKVTAAEDGAKETVVMERSVDVNDYFQENKSKIFVPFFAYRTGSVPVTVTATLRGGKDAKGTSSLRRTIQFTGGE